MAKTVAQLITEIATNLLSGNPSVLTAASLRTTLGDIVGSFQPVTQINAQSGTTYTSLVGDLGLLVILNNASPVAVTLPQATGSFAVFDTLFKTAGAGTATITPTTSTINGGASLALPQNYSAIVVSDTANYQAIIVPPVSLTGQLSLAPTSGDAITINPAASTYGRAVSSTQSGPSSSIAGPIAYNLISVTHSGTITGAGTDAFGLNNTNSTALRVNMTVTGANWGGQATTALMGNAVITGTVPVSGTDVIGSSGTFYTNVDASVTTAGGYGQNSYAHLGASGKINHLASHEADVQIDNSTAGSARVRRAYAAVNSGAFAASVIDAAYTIASSVAGGAFQHVLFAFTDGGYNQTPITSTGDFIGTNIVALPLGSVINLPTAVVSGNYLNFLNATLSGAGALTIKGGTSTVAAASGWDVRSGASGSFAQLTVGRTATELALGVAGASAQFTPGTVAGDSVVQYATGSNFFLGLPATAALKADTSARIFAPVSMMVGGLTTPTFKMNVSANTGTIPSNPGGLGADIVSAHVNADGSNSRIAIFAAGANKAAGVSYLVSRGTLATPTATQINDVLGSNFWYGSDGSNYLASAGFVVVSAQLFAAGVGTAHLDLYSGQANANARLWASSGLSLGAAIGTDPGAGGFLASASIKSNGATAGIGYATGAGGTVTQGAGSGKATAVTLNTATGTITMNNAALNAATIVTFVFNNSAIAATDGIFATHESAGTTGAYTINARATGAGTAAVDVRNNTAGPLSEAIVIRFWTGKSVNS